MSKDMTASRRAFIKSGAIAAAPLAVALPTAAFAADDGSKSRLALLEDEKAIEALHRDYLRRFDAAEGAKLARGLTGLADEPADAPHIAFADNGRRATCRRACRASFRTDFTGHSTLEQMHRLQGQGLHQHDERRVLIAEYTKGQDGWAIASLRLA